jgi:hypothetical protein
VTNSTLLQYGIIYDRKKFIVVALRVVVEFKMLTKSLLFSGTRSAVLPMTAPGLAPRPADPRAARSTKRIPR